MPNKLNMLPRQPTLMAKLVELQEENARLREDAERMTYLESIAYQGINRWRECLWCLRGLFGKDGQTFREAIDDARKEQK